MPPPNSVLTATVGEGQLAPPDALHTAVLLGERQLSPAPGVSLSSTLDAASGPLFVTVSEKSTMLPLTVEVGEAVFTTRRSVLRVSLVKVHEIGPAVLVACAFSVTDLVARFTVAVPPVPRPVQTTERSSNGAGGTASVMVVATPAAVRVCVAPATAVPAVLVVMLCGWMPLVPVKPNVPTPSTETLRTVNDGHRTVNVALALLLDGSMSRSSHRTSEVSRGRTALEHGLRLRKHWALRFT